MGMELGLTEMPLALFSTLAPMGAGAFTLLAVAFLVRGFELEVLRRIDRFTVIPLIFIVVGFICAFFHLASPFNAFGVFANIGTSPMSNEILVGVIFCIVAIVYWIVAIARPMGEGLRKGFSVVVALCGLIFCLFIGLAYGMDTIPSWNDAMVPLSTLFFGVLGGSAVGMAVLYCAGAGDSEDKTFNTAAMAVSWIGVIGSALFFGLNMAGLAGLQNNMMSGMNVLSNLLPWVVTSVIVMVIAGIGLMLEIRKERVAFYPWLVIIVAFIGILIARIAFYGAEFSIGLGM